MATQLNQAQSQNSDRLSFQTMQNPKNVTSITFRSGKQIDVPAPAPVPEPEPTLEPVPEREEEDNLMTTKRNMSLRNGRSSFSAPYVSGDLQQPPIPLPFPLKIIPTKKMEEVDKEILETLRKVEVDIPLLDVIKQISKYAKFLKELCTHKRKMKGHERINMGRNVSALIGKSIPHIPDKCKDPGTFYIPCVIGNNKFENAMLDLGASINVMSLSIYKSLSLGPMQPTDVVIQLTNRSVAHPIGLIEYVLVRVGELIFPADFYVLDMEEGFSHRSVPIILDRPFLKTARTKIDVYAGTLSMEFGDTIAHFNILDAMKHPLRTIPFFRAELIDDIVDEYVLHYDSLHSKKHSLSDLHTSMSSCTEVDHELDFCSESIPETLDETLGVVPFDIDSIESECINHVAGSTCEYDL